MKNDFQPTKTKRKLVSLKKEDSSRELTFSYAFDCLTESTARDGFLGFTLSLEYVPVHKSRSDELSFLQNYFPLEVLQAVIVWCVEQQSERVIRWTDREEMQDYLRLHGAISSCESA